MIPENFIKIYESSFRENWDLPALTDYNEQRSYTYQDMAREIAKLHILFRHCQIRRGDKIALVGKNTPNWCVAFMATVSYGAILVPILIYIILLIIPIRYCFLWEITFGKISRWKNFLRCVRPFRCRIFLV